MKTSSIFFSPHPLPSFETAYALLRMGTGLLITYHGWEVFDGATMATYAKWLTDLKFPAPVFLSWLGKSGELLGGLGILFGLFTRLSVIPVIIAMLVVCFGMGHGKFWYEDQHPFMFVLLGILFGFGGGGKWSLDGVLFEKNLNN